MIRRITSVSARAVILLAMVVVASVAVAQPHPYLTDAEANQVWLAPAGTGHVENIKPLDAGERSPLVINRDKVLGRTIEIALATDAPMLMLVHRESQLAVKLSGRMDTPHVLVLKGDPAQLQVLLDDKPVADPTGAWPRIMHVNGDDALTISFIGATKAKLQFDADQVNVKDAATFFGIPADPSHPAYQKINRQHQRQPDASGGGVIPSIPAGDVPAPTDVAIQPFDGPATPAVDPVAPPQQVATDFPPMTIEQLLPSVQPSIVVVEGRLARPGVTTVSQGFIVDDAGHIAVSLDALQDVSEVSVVFNADSSRTKVKGELTALDARTGLALIKAPLPAGAAPLKLAELPPGTGVTTWLVGAASSREPAYSEGRVAEPQGWNEVGTSPQPAAGLPRGTKWLSVRCVLQTADGGAVVVNPKGEAVALSTWQWFSGVDAYRMLAIDHVRELVEARPATPPAMAELRGMRNAGVMPGFVPVTLRIDTTQPAAALQRECISLKRSYSCRTCDGKGEIIKQVHKQTKPSTGAGKDWYEATPIECPTCKGARLAPAESLGRLLEGVTEAMAMGDTDDPRWAQMTDFTAQTLNEVMEASPDNMRSALQQGAAARLKPARVRVGQPVVITGRVQAVRAPALLTAPDCLLIQTDDGQSVVMIDTRLNRAGAFGGTGVAVGGLYAGQVRLPNARIASVLQNGWVTQLPANDAAVE